VGRTLLPSPLWGGVGGGGRCDGARNLGKDAVYIGQHLVIPESQHAVTVSLKSFRTFLIYDDILHVLPTVNFNNEFGAMAREIRNVGANANLPPEVSAR